MKRDGNLRVGMELLNFARLVVRVENKIARIRDEFLAEHDAGRGPAVISDRHERHRIRVALYALSCCFLEPCRRPVHGIFGQ